MLGRVPSYSLKTPFRTVSEGEFSEVHIAAVQHPWGSLVETGFLQILSSLLGAQETDGQHRHPHHGGVDVDALLNPHPWRRFVCLHLASLQARQNAKHDEYSDCPVRVVP